MKINVSIVDCRVLGCLVNTKMSLCSGVINAVTTQGIDMSKKIIAKTALKDS